MMMMIMMMMVMMMMMIKYLKTGGNLKLWLSL